MSTVALPGISPEICNILDELFTLCRVPFVHDFIFTDDPVADISILTAPVQNEHAIAARITTNGTESSAKFAHIFDYSVDMYFVSVPAFSVGSITVGFCTQEHARGPTHASLHEPVGAQRVQCNRFVRDDERGVFLTISENCTNGVTEVDCMSHRSTRKRMRVYARFDTEKLKRKLRTEKGLMNPNDISESLSYLSVTNERRKCPICMASDNGECGCSLPLRRPIHPLDFRNERCNMSLYTGRYEGGSTVRLFNAACPFIITSLATKSVIKGSIDRAVISRLNKFAVQDRMSKLRVNPASLAMPAMGGSPDLPCTTPELTFPMASQVSVGGAGDDDSMAMAEVFFKDETASTSANLLNFVDPLTGASVVPALALEPAPPSFEMQHNGTIFDGYGSGTPEMGAVAGENNVTRRNSVERTQEKMDGSVEGAADEVRGEEKEGKKGGPCKTIKKVSGSDGTVNKMGDKELKAELRRQRNRDAAAKSNVKRKIRNEALRRDLAEVNKRANELRSIERQLREENVRLRSQATRKEIKVSSKLTHIQIAK